MDKEHTELLRELDKRVESYVNVNEERWKNHDTLSLQGRKFTNEKIENFGAKIDALALNVRQLEIKQGEQGSIRGQIKLLWTFMIATVTAMIGTFFKGIKQ